MAVWGLTPLPPLSHPLPKIEAFMKRFPRFSANSLLAQYHNTPLLPPKNLHRHCFRFPLGHLHVPGEIADNDYAKFLGGKEVYYGICASRE